MSDAYLFLGLAAAFGAIVMAGVVVDLVARQRGNGTLEARVGNVRTELWQEQAEAPFWQRAILPGLSGLRSLGSWISPAYLRRRIARQLVLAGSPGGWDAEKVAALQVVATVPGAFAGAALARVVGLPDRVALAATVLVGAAGFLTPVAILSRAAAARQLKIRKALPDTMDLLTISVEAGLGLNAAIAQVVRGVPGPLSEELSRMLHEIHIGLPRVEAFRHLGERTDVEELDGFVLSMIQADTFGVSVGRVLRVQSKELRVRRRQRAEEQAQKLPIKILFPLIFFILPALFVVVAGPGVIRIIRTFFMPTS